MILIVAILLGILVGLFLPYNLTSDTLPYVAIALIAALDSVFGGFYSYLKKRFQINIFVSGFFFNAILAAILTFMGNKLGINLSFAVIVVFGTRIFNNASSIRRMLLDKMMMESVRRKRQDQRRLPAVEGSSVSVDDTENEEFDDTDLNEPDDE